MPTIIYDSLPYKHNKKLHSNFETSALVKCYLCIMKTLAVLLIVISSAVYAQLTSQQIEVPQKFLGRFEPGYEVRIDGQYKIDLFYTDNSTLKRPRFMAVGRNGVLYVADLGSRSIYAIPDFDGDGVGDTTYDATAFQVDSVHSIFIWKDTMYVAEPSRVRKFIDNNRDGYFDLEAPFITGINTGGPYDHYTRTIFLDTVNRQVYLSIGASCNACREQDYQRATIQQYSINAAVSRTYASGLRNAIGLTIDPEFNTLWATNADRDGLGDDIPQEIISPISENGFYGWPFAYGNKSWVDFNATPEYQALLPLTQLDSIRVGNMQVAPIQVEAHSTPMGIIFYKDPRIYFQAPPKTILVARHGSSKGGRPVALGYDVLRFQQDKDTKEWSRDTFLTGFLIDSVDYTYWGRPCGLVQDTLGEFIYLSSDAGIPAIYRISIKGFSKVDKAEATSKPSIFPNPTEGSFFISSDKDMVVQVYSLLGTEFHAAIERTISGYHVTLADVRQGFYLCRLTSATESLSLPLIIR